MKKILSCILILATVFALAQPAFAAQPDEITPQYVNARQAEVYFSINSSGLAMVTVTCCGNTGLKKASVTTYLEKKVNGAWTRVDISAANDEWVYSTTSQVFSKSYSAQLSGAGQYRAVAKFTLTAATVEYITDTCSATY